MLQNSSLCHCEASPIWGPRGILCTRGEKAHTSKRVSIIAPDNAISKAKLCDASPGREPLYLIRCPFPAIPTLARNDVVLRTSYKYFPKTKAPKRVL